MEKLEEEENLFEADEEDDEEGPKLTSTTRFSLKELIDEGVVFDVQDIDNTENKSGFYIDDTSKYFHPELIEDDSDSPSENGETSDKADDVDLSPFEKLAKKMTNITNDAGVLKKVLQKGTVDFPDNALVTIHYSAFLEYGDEPFDSSRLRNKPLTFRLKDGGVVRGLEIGVSTMQLGEVSQFLLSYKYAYGKMGCPPRIPAESTILYEVEVIDYVDYSVSIDDKKLSEEEMQELGFEKLMAAIKSEHILGNDLFNRNNVTRALARYRKASRFLERITLDNDEQDQQYKKMVVKVSSNLALCLLRMNNPIEAQTHCNKVLEVDPRNVKALFRKGKAKMMLGDYEDARSYLVRAKNISPASKDIVSALLELDERMQDYKRQSEAFCVPMFKSTSSMSTSLPRPPSSVATCGSLSHISDVTEVKEQGAASVQTETSLNHEDFGVSDKFANMVHEKLERFKDDDREFELCFSGKCSVEEIAFIGSVAYLHSLRVTHDQDGLKITK